MCSVQLLSSTEMETKMVRRECIASIIDILSAANSDDKEDNLRRIKEEFNLKKSWSSGTVLKELIARRRQLDIELGRKKKEEEERPLGGSEPGLKLGGSEPRLKRVKVQLTKLPSIAIANSSRTSQTSAKQLLKKSPPTLVAVLCKGKTKKADTLAEKVRKRVTWWDGYKNIDFVNM